MPKFNIGDRVRIRAKEELSPQLVEEEWTPGMEDYANCEAIITRRGPFAKEYFDINLSRKYWWPESFFELIPDTDSSKMEVASNHDILSFLRQEA